MHSFPCLCSEKDHRHFKPYGTAYENGKPMYVKAYSVKVNDYFHPDMENKQVYSKILRISVKLKDPFCDYMFYCENRITYAIDCEETCYIIRPNQ